ncbi:hypothetical protein BC629DRAFT_1011603 [Irpex lacteus]|nr:hypothetical protein BC629DRAFT_1011603 [Irpex lacteus]
MQCSGICLFTIVILSGIRRPLVSMALDFTSQSCDRRSNIHNMSTRPSQATNQPRTNVHSPVLKFLPPIDTMAHLPQLICPYALDLLLHSSVDSHCIDNSMFYFGEEVA